MNIVFNTIVSFLRDENYRSLLLTTIIIIAVGSVFYHFVENWTWIDSVYFCVVTLTTIGFGDFAPKTDFGKIFTIFYIFIGIGMILTFINTLYAHYSKIKIKK
jgi:hypothetical protein